jgi:hypothetical protein
MVPMSMTQYAPMVYLIFSLLMIALLIFALVDLITTDNSQVKHLPKFAWILIILFFPLVGSIVWLLAGKDRSPIAEGWGSFGDPNRQRDVAPKSTTEQQLEALDREIEFHEKQDKIKRLEAELERKRRSDPNS